MNTLTSNTVRPKRLATAIFIAICAMSSGVYAAQGVPGGGGGRLEDIESHAQLVVQKTVSSIVLGMWAATTVAISLVLRGVMGTTPPEWIGYTVVVGGLALAWNIAAMVGYYRQFKRLDDKWQRRVLALATNCVTLYHVVAVGVRRLNAIVLISVPSLVGRKVTEGTNMCEGPDGNSDFPSCRCTEKEGC